MRKTYVIGNWKMQGSKSSIDHLLKDILDAFRQGAFSDIEVVVCPPFVYLDRVAHTIRGTGIKLGAQNVFDQKEGAYTGEVSPNMLLDIGCQYVIIGHSERRHLLKESDEWIAKKCLAVYDIGLFPVLCVGETAEERKHQKTFEVVRRQIEAVLKVVPLKILERMLIAYEPVWAIGTGDTATPEQAQTVHAVIRETLSEWDEGLAEQVPLLYGGSIKPNNARALFSEPDIDGGLVGGASLVAKDFVSICDSALVRIL